MSDDDKKPHHPLDAPDYLGFKPTEQVLTLDEAKWAELSVLKPHPTLKHVLDKPGAIDAIVKRLEEYGFRRVHGKLIFGSYSFVLEGHDNQMVRIVSAKHEQERPKRPYVLQPITTETISDCRIEVLPKVHTLDQILNSKKLCAEYGYVQADRTSIASGILHRMSEVCKSDGHAFSDQKSANIGILINEHGENVPVIIDPGSLARMADGVEADEATLAIFTKAQAAHRAQLDLHTGILKNVIDALAQDGGTSLFSSGVSRSERGHVIDAAMKDSETAGQGFCQRIDHEWQKRHRPSSGKEK